MLVAGVRESCCSEELCMFFVRGSVRALFVLGGEKMSNIINKEFESAFSDYLDSESSDKAESALFDIVRQAFAAGWKAAKQAGTNNK